MKRLTLAMVLITILIGATAYAEYQDYRENEVKVWVETPFLLEGGVSFTNECGEPYFSLLIGVPNGVGLRLGPYYYDSCYYYYPPLLTATTGFFSGGQLTLTWPNHCWRNPLLYIEGGVIELWTINDYYGPAGVIGTGILWPLGPHYLDTAIDFYLGQDSFLVVRGSLRIQFPLG